MSCWRKALAVLSLLACASAPAPAQEQPAPQINLEAVEGLVKYTIVAVDQANLTGNYTVLRGLATPQFQKTTTPAMLAKSFARMRQTKVEMSTVLLVKPSFTTPPVLDKGVLKVAGVFPTKPTQIAFQATYVNVKGRMRLAGLKITPTKAAADAATTAGKKADQQP